MKIAAESNRWVDDAKDTKFFFREAHLRFHANKFETHLFTGQDRFWLNEPLLQIVDSGQVKHDDYGPRAQGIRLDFWDTHGFSGAAFVSERSDYVSVGWSELSAAEQGYYPGAAAGDTISSSTDDYRGFRINKKVFHDQIQLGSTYARKDFNNTSYGGSRSSFDEIIAFDAEFALGELVPPLTSVRDASPGSPSTGATPPGTCGTTRIPASTGSRPSFGTSGSDPSRFLGSCEDVRQGLLQPGAGDRRQAEPERLQRSTTLEGHYRVPTKAVNLKGWIRHAEPEDPMVTSHAQSVGVTDEWGSEAYLEFLNGFTGKTEYKVYEDNNGTWPNLFFELTGENRLVKLRTQFRIKDIDTDYELTAYGFEANVNLSDVLEVLRARDERRRSDRVEADGVRAGQVPGLEQR